MQMNLKGTDLGAWSGLIWLSIGTGGGLLCTRNKS
jgi:hypothetical protein